MQRDLLGTCSADGGHSQPPTWEVLSLYPKSVALPSVGVEGEALRVRGWTEGPTWGPTSFKPFHSQTQGAVGLPSHLCPQGLSTPNGAAGGPEAVAMEVSRGLGLGIAGNQEAPGLQIENRGLG